MMKLEQSFKCHKCGKLHISEWPALVYPEPLHYSILSETDKINSATIDEDFCVIKHDDQTDHFIRCVFIQDIKDHCELLEYGLWVSLSEKNFLDYNENFHSTYHEVTYFGWLSNYIPAYNFNTSIPMIVTTLSGNQRPILHLHKEYDHLFVHDFYNGISFEDANRRIKNMMSNLT